MNSMPPEWKSRWCNSYMCACMGCANKSGGLTAKGYTYEDWRDWVSRNKEEYMNGLSPIKEVKWSIEPKEMTINLEDYIGKTVEVELRNGNVWTGHKVKVDRITFNQFKYLIGGGDDYYNKLGLHSYCNLYDIVKIKVLKPNVIPHGQEKKMLDKKDDLVCEIQDLQNEIDEHTRKLNQLKTRLEQKEQQLNEIPITLERIIIECMIAYDREIRLEILENILDRVEVEFLSHKVVMDEQEPIVDVVEYHRGWDNCLKELKRRLRE